MRKLIVLSFLCLLVVSFSTAVYAQKVDFKASGSLFMASFLGENVPQAYDIPTWQPYSAWLPSLYGPSPLLNPAPGFGKALDKTRSFMQSRGILRLESSVSKQVSGTAVFEMDSGEWGERGEGRNNMGRWNADQAAVEIKSLFMDVAIPYIGIQVPMTSRIGLQPLALRPHMLVYTDGMGISGGITIDPVTIQPLWFKALEGRDYTSDDIDVYGLHLLGKFGKITVGGYGLYYNQNTYPIPTAISSTNEHKSDMWWFGLYSDGRIGPVETNFDFVIDTGKVEAKLNPAHPDVKYNGWATRLKVDYPWEKFNFGVVGAYGSGSDQKKTDNTGLPGTTTPFSTPSTKVSGYVVPPGSENFPFGDSLLLSGQPIWGGFMGYSVLQYNQVSRGWLGGVWIAKLYGSVKPTPWYKVTLSGIYIGDTTKNGNTVGNARTAAGLPRDDKTFGFEFDLINEINIYKNLKWDIGLGYLSAGKALEYFDAVAGRNKDGKDPWALVTRLTYTF